MPKRKTDSDTVYKCTCGAPLILSRIKAGQWVAVCSRPCMETRIAYGSTDFDAAGHYIETMEAISKGKRVTKNVW